MAWPRSAIVLRKPPSFLEALLSGTGLGITQSLERYMKERERKRGMKQNVMEMVLSGRMPEEAAATDMFQKYAESAKIADEPEIQDLIWGARRRFAPEPTTKLLPESGAAVTMPSAAPMDVSFRDYEVKMKEKQIKEEEKAWRRALARKLKEYEITDKFKGELARKNAIQNIMRAEVEAKKAGQEIQDIDVNWTTGNVSVNYLLPSERKEKETKNANKAETLYRADFKAYNSNAKTARLRRTKLITDLAKIKAGVTSGDSGIQAILDTYDIKSGDPDTIFKILYREANKEIDQYNRREKEDAKKLKLKPGQRERLKRISPNLEDVEPKEALSAVDTRHTINPPPVKPEPTNEEINTEVKTLMDSGAIDPGTGQPYTLEKAKEIALKFLKGK